MPKNKTLQVSNYLWSIFLPNPTLLHHHVCLDYFSILATGKKRIADVATADAVIKVQFIRLNIF